MEMTENYAWAQKEFGGANLGDERRTLRLVKTVASVSARIGVAISGACGRAGALAVSRLFSRKETTLEAVVEPHIERTKERCMGDDRILAVQDTTILDYTSHKCTKGLGPVTTSQNSRGLLMHSVLAVSREGIPLGLLGTRVWARDEAARGSRTERHNRPVCEKESNKWLVGLEQAQRNTAKEQRLLVIGDRESDVYSLFVAPRRENVDLLVRVAHNRALAETAEEGEHLFSLLERSEKAGEYEVEVSRQGTRQARTAKLEVRIARVHLKSPRHGVDKHVKRQVEVSLIRALEREAPSGTVPLEWVLLCTESVGDLASAIEMIKAYTARWVIEEFHHVLKSGCRVEHIQFDTVEAMLPAIGILAVVAWRVLYLTKRVRHHPYMDAMEVADEDEITVLRGWLRAEQKTQDIYTARDFTIAVAMLGGFLARKSDGMPGTKTVWQGLRNLEILVMGYRMATRAEM